MRVILIGAALAAASLAGCAGVNGDVQVSNPLGTLVGERTYALVRAPFQDASHDDADYPAAVRGALLRRGFAEAAVAHAHYLVSVAYDTRADAIGVTTDDCATQQTCVKKHRQPFSLFHGPVYNHSLTLRFFERGTGEQVAKVTASRRDTDPDSFHAAPVLVKSALEKIAPGAVMD